MIELTLLELDKIGFFPFSSPKEVELAKNLVQTFVTYAPLKIKEHPFFHWKAMRQQIFFWN